MVALGAQQNVAAAVKARPRITKGPDGWMVKRPRPGFVEQPPDGPYPSYTAALESLKPLGGGMVLITESAETPEPPYSYWGDPPALWPAVIR